VSYQEIKQKDPNAAQLLQLFAYLDFHDIWLELIMNGNRGPNIPQWYQDVTKSKVELLRIISLFREYSMLQKNSDSNSYSVQPVLHHWLGVLSKDCRSELLRLSVLAVSFSAPVEEENKFWVLEFRLLPHATKVYDNLFGNDFSGELLDFRPSARYLDAQKSLTVISTHSISQLDHPFRRFGLLLHHQRQFCQARAVFTRAIEEMDTSNGAELLLVLRLKSLLADTCGELGCNEREQELALEAWDGCVKLLGPEHQWTLSARSVLAASQFSSGKTEAGLKMLEENIAVYRKIPSGYDGDLAEGLRLLSSVYWKLGRFEEAIDLGQESVRICERTFGVDHFRTLVAIDNLACAYMEGKRYAEAEKELRKAIQGYEDYVGKISKPRARLEERLGTLYMHEERFDDALDAFAEALEIRSTAEGMDAISVLSDVNSVSHVLLLQWKKNVLLPVLQKGDGKYTMKHSTHITDSELYGWFVSMQDYEKAEKIFLKNLGIMLFWYGKTEAS
jgi:tetratricopeptide (TPR) repeat protein